MGFEGAIQYIALCMVAVIGFLLKRLVSEHQKTREEIIIVLTAQAEDRIRFAALAESIVDLKKSDEKITEQLIDAITRLVRIEEKTNVTKTTVKRGKP